MVEQDFAPRNWLIEFDWSSTYNDYLYIALLMNIDTRLNETIMMAKYFNSLLHIKKQTKKKKKIENIALFIKLQKNTNNKTLKAKSDWKKPIGL